MLVMNSSPHSLESVTREQGPGRGSPATADRGGWPDISECAC